MMKANSTFVSGWDALGKILPAVGLDPKGTYQRVVLVFDGRDLPKVYATKIATADDVLRVVETLDGVKVEAKDDDTVEIVTLTEKWTCPGCESDKFRHRKDCYLS